MLSLSLSHTHARAHVDALRVSNAQVKLADGPLGGFFYDNSTVSVWVTTANNILMR
jgi:hypothetical protein